METTLLAEHLTVADEMVNEAEMPVDPFERSDLVDHALVLAADLLAFVQRLRAERAPYVATYSIEERLAHRRADLEPPKDRPEHVPPPPPEPEPDPPPSPTPDPGGDQ